MLPAACSLPPVARSAGLPTQHSRLPPRSLPLQLKRLPERMQAALDMAWDALPLADAAYDKRQRQLAAAAVEAEAKKRK